MNIVLTDTIGRGNAPEKTPDCAGFPALELEKVTVIGFEVALLFA